MIYFDFDGVIRDLCTAIGQPFDSWDTLIDGKTFVDYIDDNLHLLLDAPPTEYYSVINNYSKDIVIMTCQPELWRPSYEKWIDAYFSNRNVKTIFVENISDKMRLLQKEDFLVDDYPRFNDYSQVILIKRVYNRFVKGAYMETKYPEELQKFLDWEAK